MKGISSKGAGTASPPPRRKEKRAVSSPPDGPSAISGPGQTAPSAARKSVLIIEDDQTTQHIIRHFLEKDGFEVDSAGDAHEGLRQAREKRPALILLDLMLPGMSGFQVLSLLKQEDSLASVPVIIISSLIQEDNIMKALTSGAVDYVTKPFSPVVLVTKIKLLLTGRS
jgi:two-component system, OmpR family, phosphate regulon response regulator PhoB